MCSLSAAATARWRRRPALPRNRARRSRCPIEAKPSAAPRRRIVNGWTRRRVRANSRSCFAPTSRTSVRTMSRSSKGASGRRSRTTESSFALAAFCQMRFSRRPESKWRQNMARPRASGRAGTGFPQKMPSTEEPRARFRFNIAGTRSRAARVFLPVAISLAVLIDGTVVLLAQSSGDSVTRPAIDSAVRTGNFSQAASLLEKDAKAGLPEAQYQLASLYRSGRGLPQDDGLAFKWMKASADQGHKKAQFNLANMYLAGRGVERDVNHARTLLSKAAAQGHDEAAKLLATIAAQRPTAPPGPNSTATASKETPGSQSVPKRSAVATQPATRNGRPALLDAAWRG